MVAAMKYGAVIVDMAAESGGNVEGTVCGEIVQVGHVKIVGHANLPSRMPFHASEMYARNLFNFLSPHLKDGVLSPDWNDEVVADSDGALFMPESRRPDNPTNRMEAS
jgi:NAD(P) transhydrogenase subunit alpha